MKIYKSNLQELLNEALPPFYLFNFAEWTHSKTSVRAVKVSLAGYNQENRICELVLSTMTVWDFDDAGKAAQARAADQLEQELRSRLKALSLEIRDGRISDEPVIGALD
jgi:hypothetical protein